MSAFRLLTQSLYVVRSTDGGQTWDTLPLRLQLGQDPIEPRILGVDPEDSETLYVRLSNGAQDAIAISNDAGDSFRVALQLDTRMTAFLRRPSGSIVVATADGATFESSDGGSTFELWSSTFPILALAEREGAIYASSTDDLGGFVLVVSDDDGDHWKELWKPDRVLGVLSCGAVETRCEGSWQRTKLLLLNPSPTTDTGVTLGSSNGCSVGRPDDGLSAA